MRQFSNIEKQIISVILQERKQIHNLICNYLENETILVSHAAENKVTLFIDKRKYPDQNLINRAYEITEKIVIIVNLLHYLETQGLITFFIPSHGVPFAGHITKTNELYEEYRNTREHFSGWWYTDKKTETYLLSKHGFTIYPSEELKVHVNNIYVSAESKRHNQTIIATWVAIVISVLLGLYGIFKDSGDDTQKIKIEESQKKELIDALQFNSKTP